MVGVGRGGSTWTVCPEGTYPIQHTLRHSEPHSSAATSTTPPAHIRMRKLKQLTVDDRPATGVDGVGVGGDGARWYICLGPWHPELEAAVISTEPHDLQCLMISKRLDSLHIQAEFEYAMSF